MKTLVILDDLIELIQSKNPFIRFWLSVYIRYLAWHTQRALKAGKEGSVCYVSAPKELLSLLDVQCEKLDYGLWFDTIEFAKGGQLSREIDEKLENSQELKKACPVLFDSPISVPKIGSVRLTITFCYNGANHYLLLQNMIERCAIEKIAVLGTNAEIEKTALEIARQRGLASAVLYPRDFILKLKTWLSNFLYHRDRRLHVLDSFQTSEKLQRLELHSNKKVICILPAHSLHFRMLTPFAKALNKTDRYEACVLLQDSFVGYGKELE